MHSFPDSCSEPKNLSRPGRRIGIWLTKEELHCMSEAFTLENQRVFRLTFIAISQHLHFRRSRLSYVISDWMIRTRPVLEHFAMVVVVKLGKRTL